MIRRTFIAITMGVLVLAAALHFVATRPVSSSPPATAPVRSTSAAISASRSPDGVVAALGVGSRHSSPEGSKKLPKPSTGPKAQPVRQVAVKGSSSVLKANATRLALKVTGAITPLGVVIVEPASPNESAEELAVRLRRSGVVTDAEPGHPTYATWVPDDPLFTQQWGFLNTGQDDGVPGADSKATAAWDWSRGDGVVVAVVDTGIDFGANDLSGQQWVNVDEIPGNRIDDDNNGYIDDINGFDFAHGDGTIFDAKDGDQHGTHVAGTIAASTGDGQGCAGMATEARLMSIKFLTGSGGSDVNAAAGIVYAVDNGAKVINGSFGATGYSATFLDAVDYAARRGVLFVVAAGNDGLNIDSTPRYPASLPSTNIVSVAALDRFDGLATFSNRGASGVDLGAPGVEVLSTLPPQLPGAMFVDASPHKVVYLGFPLESVTSTAVRRAILSTSMSHLATSTESSILLVDDSWQSRSLAYEPKWRSNAFLADLNAVGYSQVTTWASEVNGIPPASVMASKTVVWFTGACTYQIPSVWSTTSITLGSAERTQLTTFLNGGGRMLLSSGEFAEEMMGLGSMSSGSIWMRNYLHATCAGGDPFTGNLVGLEGSFLSGLNAVIDDPIRYTDVSDELGAYDASATPLAMWPHEFAAMNGTSMAAPHVTGALALLMSRVTTMTGEAAKAHLLATVDPVPALAGLSVSGGRLDAAELVGTLPAPVPLRAWSVGPGTLQVAWTNPAGPDFRATRLLARTDTSPVGPEDASATVVYEGGSFSAPHSGLTSGTEVHYAAYSRGAYGAWSEAATLSAVASDPPPGIPLPVGTGVKVLAENLSLTFPSVAAPGWLSITRVPPRHEPPVGTRWVGDHYYDIHPVGEFATPVDIELPYAPFDVGGEEGLRLYHWTGAEWEDVTVEVDTWRNVVRARATSFSDYGLAEPLGGPMIGADAGSMWLGLAFGGLSLVLAEALRRRRHRAQA